MPPPRSIPGRANPKPNPGGRVDAERSSERKARGIRPNPYALPTAVGPINRKRSSDATDESSASNKRRRVAAIAPNPSSLVSGRVGFTAIQRTPVIDLTVDEEAPDANSSDTKRLVKSTSSTLLDSPPRKGQSAPRYSRPLFPPTPTRGPEGEPEVIDLTLESDSDDGQAAPSSTGLKKDAQPQATGDVVSSPSVKKPVVSAPLVDFSRQRPESKHEQARPANSAEKKGAKVLTRVYPSFAKVIRPEQPKNGPPRVSKALTAPMKSASMQKITKKIPLANGLMPLGHDGEAHRDLGVLVGASKLEESSILVVRDRPQKQNELVDGHAEVSNELKPPPPRSARQKRSKIVVLTVPPAQLLRFSPRPVQRPDIPTGVCFLIEMPPEILDMIFKDLLLAADPIQVLHGWAKLYQRQRSNLHPAILCTCKKISKMGIKFLYGQNVFRYMVRDRAQSGAFPMFSQDINVEEYVPFFRKLELKIERSRTERAYCTSLANAIQLLNTNGADLHTLVLDVSPVVEGDTLSTVGYFYQNGEIIQALKTLSTNFIIVRVSTPKTEKEPATSLCRKLDMRTVVGPSNQPPQTQLDNLSELITRACESPSRVVAQGLFEKFEVVALKNERGTRPSTMTYTEDDDDDDDDGGANKDGDGDDSGDYQG